MMPDADGATAGQAARQEWSDRAEAWRRWAQQWAAQTRPATDLLLQAAGVQPGWRVLDVASGGGEPALSLAMAVGATGHVMVTDLAPEMLAITQEFAQQRQVRNMTCQVADAQALPFAGASFDAVTCRFGIALVPDPGRALAEIYRVLAPGGRTAFVSWGPREANPFFTIIDEACAPYIPANRPDSSPSGPFTFATPGSLPEALRAAGFRQVQEEVRQITLRWPGAAEEAWAGRHQMSLSCLRLLELLTPEQRDQVSGTAIAALRRFEVEGQVALPGTVIVAWAAR